MGIPGFFMFIKARYPITVYLVNTLSVIPQCDNLFIDMNSIIHDITHIRVLMPSKISYEVLASRLMYELDKIIMFLNPQKLLYIAVDGTAPRSKLSIRGYDLDCEETDDLCEEDLEILAPINLTPGMEVMERVSNILQYYISLRISTDPVWKKLTVVYSSHRFPGEGEHKIIDYLRQSIANGTYKDSDHTLFYGGDADLILLAMTLHKNNINIIRKEEYYDSTWEMKYLIDVISCYVTKQ